MERNPKKDDRSRKAEKRTVGVYVRSSQDQEEIVICMSIEIDG